MDPSPQSQHKYRFNVLTGLAVAAGLMALLAAVLVTPDRQKLWGDEGTYVAMTASLVRDGDLEFSAPDAEWVVHRQPDSPVTVILQETPKGITYSKPVLYPLLSAPLFAIFDEAGMVATQVLMLIASLGLAWVVLRQFSGSVGALWILSTVIVGSVVLVYAGWKMSDLTLFALTLAGLVLALGGRRLHLHEARVALPLGSLPAGIVGGALLGGATSMRLTAAAIVAGTVLALLVDRRWRRALVVAVVSTTAFLAISGVTLILLGTANPYKAVRSSFNSETGYPAGATAQPARETFASRPATQSATWRPPFDARRTMYSSLYYMVGRHTGLLLYFPVALILLAHILRRPDPVSLALLLGLAVMVGFYLVWMPQNYFGGSTFVGNRYFLGALPVLVVALNRPPPVRLLASVWALAALVWASAAFSISSVRDLDRSSQSHAFAGVFRLMPAESTAQRIDGLQERFWADDYIRFLDPFAQPAAWSFRLDSSRPAAELLVATAWPGEPLEFVVSPETASVEIEVSDWKETAELVVPREPPAPPGIVEVSLSRPWRIHSFWWNQRKLYNVRVVRFTLRSKSGEDTTAVIRYAGRGRELAPLSGELAGIGSTLPIPGRAGQESTVSLKVRNTGRRPWKNQGIFPSRLGLRLLTRSDGAVVVREVVPLPRNVPPGQTQEIPVNIRWPAEPGTHDLVIEVLREPTGRLGELGRASLAILEAEVTPPLSPDIPEP